MDDRSHAEALRCFTGKPSTLRGLPFFLEWVVSEGETRNTVVRFRGGSRLFQDIAETRASVQCSICFLTLLDKARSASRNS